MPILLLLNSKLFYMFEMGKFYKFLIKKQFFIGTGPLKDARALPGTSVAPNRQTGRL